MEGSVSIIGRFRRQLRKPVLRLNSEGRRKKGSFSIVKGFFLTRGRRNSDFYRYDRIGDRAQENINFPVNDFRVNRKRDRGNARLLPSLSREVWNNGDEGERLHFPRSPKSSSAWANRVALSFNFVRFTRPPFDCHSRFRLSHSLRRYPENNATRWFSSG